MKKLFLGMAVVLALGMLASVAVAGVGNSIPVNGKHYNLNIIGVKEKEDVEGDGYKDVGDSKGHTMFVPLWRNCKIIMTQDLEMGEFKVVDRDGTDGTAEFNIAPGYYNVYAAGLGKPNRYVDITSYGWFEDALEGNVLLPLGFVNITREKGQPQSVNINKLFYVDVTLCTAIADPDGIPNSGDEFCIEETVYTDTWVFDIEELLEYFWDYNNNGLKLLQVRFYPCTLDCTGTASDYCRWGTTSEEFPDGEPICSSKTVTPLPAPALRSNVTTTWGDIKE